MKMQNFILIFSLVLILTASAYAEDHESKTPIKVPIGMEIKKIGDVKVLVPKGTRIVKKEEQIFIEGDSEYAAREFVEVKNRINELERKQEELKKEIKHIEKSLERLLNSAIVVEQKVE